MVMTISNICRMSESSEVEGGGTTATAVGSTNASAVVSPIEVGGGCLLTPKCRRSKQYNSWSIEVEPQEAG